MSLLLSNSTQHSHAAPTPAHLPTCHCLSPSAIDWSHVTSYVFYNGLMSDGSSSCLLLLSRAINSHPCPSSSPPPPLHSNWITHATRIPLSRPLLTITYTQHNRFKCLDSPSPPALDVFSTTRINSFNRMHFSPVISCKTPWHCDLSELSISFSRETT